VRVDTGIFVFISCVIFILTYFFWTGLDEEVCRFGHWMCRVSESY
jgi:hypothetical protein